MRYAYYPGCSLGASAKEYDQSLRAVCQRLGIELTEMENWNCCGATPAFTIDPFLATALAARNLAIAEQEGLPMLTPCTACYKNLRKASESIAEDPELREKVNEVLTEHNLEGNPVVKLPLEVVVNDFGLNRLEIERPLVGLKVACYYGCPVARPKSGFDNIEAPQSLDCLMKTLGAEPVSFAYRTKCCGGPIVLPQEEIALDLTGRLLVKAKQAGANCLVLACSLCHLLLDAYQPRIERRLGMHLGLPVFYFSQLLGLALGVDRERLGLEINIVSPSALLENIGVTT